MPNTHAEGRLSAGAGILVDNPGAPDVFADAIIGAFLKDGNVHMTFASRRCDYTKDPNLYVDVVIGRLILPLAVAEHMVQFLGQTLPTLKSAMANIVTDAPTTAQ